MMRIDDYTKIFASPDELVDFLMLDAFEQDRILAELARDGVIDGVAMWCRSDATSKDRQAASPLHHGPGRKERSGPA